MTSKWHGGKGSGRRNEDLQAVRDGWDRIFGNKKETVMKDNQVVGHIYGLGY